LKIAFRKGYIDAQKLEQQADPLKKSTYGQYLLRLLEDKIY